VFGLDREGVYFALGIREDMVGQTVYEMPGLDADSFLPRLWDVADQGGGWLSYQVRNPHTGLLSTKESFVAKISDNELVGCGVFQAVNEAQAQTQGVLTAA
jgi:signal transduction histidine kinase